MLLDDKIINNIKKAHIVRGIEPHSYLTKFRNIFELLEYRVHSHPDRTYIIFYPDDGDKIVLSYKVFSEKVYKTADLLKSNGIGPEDRVATVSHNHINTVIQYFAAWCVGAAVVPINVNEEHERIKYIFESSGAKLAFVHNDYINIIEKIKPDLSALQRIYVQGSGDSKSHYPVYEKEVVKHSPDFAPDDSIKQETEALIVYTSGTTGLPKGVVLTQYNLLIDADGISKWHKMEINQRMMCVLPIHHVNGTVVTLVSPMYYGGSVVLNQKFHTHKFFHRLAAEKVQVVSVVPTLLQYLCHDYESGTDKDFFHVFEEQLIANFRHIICGAGPLTCELAMKFEEMFGLKIMHGYGLSETTCYSCFLPVDLPANEHKSWLSDYGFPSIGVEIEPNEMDIHNDRGEQVGENSRGEIVIRGHNVMKYYDKNPEANSKTFEYGWFRSGDEGFYRFDSQGRKFFFITGKLKN